MPPQAFLDSMLLMFVLLNPFLMSIYLLDLIEGMPGPLFRRVLFRGTLIAGTAFIVLAFLGDRLFDDLLQVRFASFLVFGGLVFLVISIRFVLVGDEAIRSMRGKPEHVAGSIALPFMIGPGTVSAAVVTGSRMSFGWACLAIVVAMLTAMLSLMFLKWLHDVIRKRDEELVNRYVDVVGRIMALVIGSIAVEMIFNGIDLWMNEGAS